MTQPESLSAWFTHIECLHPSAIEFGLERVLQVAEKQKLNEFQCPVITVTGTNGKGSTVALLEASLQAQGYKTATYTSPHLLTFNERIHLQGKPVEDAWLCQAFAAVDSLRAEIPLTYFEFTTLAALWLFQQPEHAPEVIILEVGVGGRLDAVNVVDADIAVITSIGLDHQHWLGETRGEILQEKLGIARPGGVLVFGDRDPPENLTPACQALALRCYRMGREFQFQQSAQAWTWQGPDEIVHTHLPLPMLALENAAIAWMVLIVLHPRLPQCADTIAAAMARCQLAGRFQSLHSGGVHYVFDVAHNPASAALLAKNLQKMHKSQRIFAIIGMLKDKDIAATLQCLDPIIDSGYLSVLSVDRGADQSTLKAALTRAELRRPYSIWPDPVTAHHQVMADRQPEDLVLVCGSFHTVAAIMTLVQSTPSNCTRAAPPISS